MMTSLVGALVLLGAVVLLSPLRSPEVQNLSFVVICEDFHF